MPDVCFNRIIKATVWTSSSSRWHPLIETNHNGPNTVPQVSEKKIFMNYALKSVTETYDAADRHTDTPGHKL